MSVALLGVRAAENRRRCFLMGSMLEYEMVVIGSGPGGQKAAIAAAKLGKSVAVIEQRQMLGGVCVNTGTIPSKRCARRSCT
jgi:NAD(P) transhydrogenase